MSRAKLIVAACTAIVALSATVAASSASAAEWNVAKAPLGAGKSASLAPATTTVKGFELVIVGSGLSVTCTGLTNNSASIVGAASFQATSLSFTGCKSNTKTCELPSTLTTKEVTGTAALGTSPASTLEIQPKAGAEALLLELPYSGETCALSLVPVKGNFTFTLPNGQTEATEHELVVSSSKLKTASNTDTLSGAVVDTLASGASWSFH